MVYKKCNKCECVGYRKDFHVDKHRKDGLRDICKNCQKIRDREYYVKNKERILKRNRSYKNSTPERYKELLVDNVKRRREKPEKYLFRAAKKRADKLNIPFDIMLSDIVIPKFCPLLGIEIKPNGMMNNRDTSPSLDRIIPGKGYTKENSWVISYRANRIKNDATINELYLIAKNLNNKTKQVEDAFIQMC